MLVVPSSNSTRRLYMGTEPASAVVPVVKYCGLKPSGLPSEQYTRVLAAKLEPAHAMRAHAARVLRLKPRVVIGGRPRMFAWGEKIRLPCEQRGRDDISATVQF